MIKLIKTLWKFLTHKANEASDALDSLITAEERINKVRRDIQEELESQKQNAVELFTSQEMFKDNLAKINKDLDRYHERARALKQKLNESPNDESLKDDLKIAATQYLETKSVYDEMKAQESTINKNVDRVERTLRALKTNKAIVDAKAESLTMKVKLYRSMKNITETGVIDIKHSFEEVEAVVQKVKYDIDASTKVNELVNEGDADKAYTNAEVDTFINTL